MVEQFYTPRARAVNGRIYKNHPTIFALDLMNEPRCLGCQDAVTAWIRMMVTYIKGIDPNHMVRAGVSEIPRWRSMDSRRCRTFQLITAIRAKTPGPDLQ